MADDDDSDIIKPESVTPKIDTSKYVYEISHRLFF